MLKFPRPGAVKTRLIPALGAARACEVYRGLVRHTLATATEFARNASAPVVIEARVAGAPDEAAARAWLGDGISIREQGEGDLGARMERAISEAVAEGAEAVVVIGADCPQLNAAHLAAAFAALREAEVVLGPADDGGYYLIGLRRSRPELFRNITWSTEVVLRQTLETARVAGVGCRLLEQLSDVDSPDDLPRWADTTTAQKVGMGRLAVIIPTLNEAENLPHTLAAVRRDEPYETIVVDGGSLDGTTEIARAHDAIVLGSPAGRAGQMNRGAAIATAEWLLFLHADTLLPADYMAHVRKTLAPPGTVAGAFQFEITGDFPGRRMIERATNFRARHRQLPYGDQALFLRRETFQALGGFQELPIMEDYVLVRRLRRLGRVALAPAAALTSGRRWRKRGVVRTTLLNQMIVLAYHLGVAPDRLARWYRGRRVVGTSLSRGIPATSTAPTLP